MEREEIRVCPCTQFIRAAYKVKFCLTILKVGLLINTVALRILRN